MHEPLVVNGTEAQVRQRLEERLCLVGDVWFPTRAEMKHWAESPAPLYVKWTRTGFEIGPRMETIPAARLAPALRGQIIPDGVGRVRLQVRLAWPRVTAVVLWGFTIALVAWGLNVSVQLWTGETHLGWLGAWFVTTLLVHGSAFVAWQLGRRQLMADLPWLNGVLSGPMVEGEDW